MGNYLGYFDPVLYPIRIVICEFPVDPVQAKALRAVQTKLALLHKVGGGPTDPDQPTSAFRIPWGVQMVPGVILLVGLFFFPYSPRWLASKDRWEEALQTLAKIHGNGDVNHPKVLAQYQEIEEALAFEREQAVSSYTALVAKGMFKRVLLGASVQSWSQLCGMNISKFQSRNPPILPSMMMRY